MGDDVPFCARHDPGTPPAGSLLHAAISHTRTAACYSWTCCPSPAAANAGFGLQRLHREGHAIAIVSNESLARFKNMDVLARHLLKKQTRVSQWCHAIGVPMLALVATAKDHYRKPDIGTWQFMTQLADKSKVEIDLSSCFFVGDAAGRAGDHSDSDKRYAQACALRFFNETEFFGSSGSASRLVE
jgi:DNA 3'-phosphatase